MIPEIKMKKEESRHQCPICEQKIAVGVLVIQFLAKPDYGGQYRIAHVSCWLKQHAQLIVMSEQFDDIKKLRNEVFVEEI